jgi:CRP-like cAMP-binding protein/Ca2+-binding EF-hand superfamily protein
MKTKGKADFNHLDPSFDMWALGVILYIMLTGVHPFDLEGEATDEQVERQIINREAPPLRNSPLTAHLTQSAIGLIEQLMQRDPEQRLTAFQMLEHPWVRGETARTGKIEGSDKKLSMYKAYKSKLEARVFADMVNWSDNLLEGATPSTQQSSLLERAFHNLDGAKRGYITKNDLRRMSGYELPLEQQSPPAPQKRKKSFFGRFSGGSSPASASASVSAPTAEDEEGGDRALNLSGFSELMGENLKNRYFPKGHIVYREGDKGDQMFFINSGTIEVTTSDGYTSRRRPGDTFGEGALLNKNRTNTSTIKCKTPVHAIEISREVFDKFMSSDDKDAKISLSEKDRSRKRERAKRLLRMYPELKEEKVEDGEFIFRVGDEGTHVYILEDGAADVMVANGKKAYTVEPGEMCGEHATRYGSPRNTSVLCTGGDKGCKFRIMSKEDFYSVLEHNPWWVNKSINDILLRRDFVKAIVMKTGKDFPDTDEAQLRKVFDGADVNKSGKLELDNIRQMLLSFDKTFSNEDLKEILDALVS